MENNRICFDDLYKVYNPEILSVYNADIFLSAVNGVSSYGVFPKYLGIMMDRKVYLQGHVETHVADNTYKLGLVGSPIVKLPFSGDSFEGDLVTWVISRLKNCGDFWFNQGFDYCDTVTVNHLGIVFNFHKDQILGTSSPSSEVREW